VNHLDNLDHTDFLDLLDTKRQPDRSDGNRRRWGIVYESEVNRRLPAVVFNFTVKGTMLGICEDCFSVKNGRSTGVGAEIALAKVT
jgi:hypothetical protein